MRTHVHAAGASRLLRGEGTRREATQGREGTIEATSFPTPLSLATKMLSRVTGRSIPDEARAPSVDVLMGSRDQRWNWLGHILRMEVHRLARQVLLQCAKPTPESVFGDVPRLPFQVAITLANNRVEWKKNRISRRC